MISTVNLINQEYYANEALTYKEGETKTFQDEQKQRICHHPASLTSETQNEQVEKKFH